MHFISSDVLYKIFLEAILKSGKHDKTLYT